MDAFERVNTARTLSIRKTSLKVAPALPVEGFMRREPALGLLFPMFELAPTYSFRRAFPGPEIPTVTASPSMGWFIPTRRGAQGGIGPGRKSPSGSLAAAFDPPGEWSTSV